MARAHVLQGKLSVSTPLVTVAMSVHNGAATLHSALQSLLWQTFPDWELLIVNDASTDASLEISRRFHDSRIRVVDEPQRKGLAARLNQCVDLARGKYVARMDSDDIAYPDRFERQVRYLESHPEIDVLGHGAVLFKGDGEIIGLYPRAERHDEICRRPWWGFPFAHPTWMGKRSWFLTHRYDERLPKAQDQDLLLRAWRTSRFAALPDCLLGYRMEKISLGKSAIGRLAYCRRLITQIHDGPTAFHALKGMAVHGVALARDVIFDVSRTMNRRSRLSFTVADESIAENWQLVWNRLREEELCLIRS
jgi:glycosyltransferase involved in cell wall biosynthesis